MVTFIVCYMLLVKSSTISVQFSREKGTWGVMEECFVITYEQAWF